MTPAKAFRGLVSNVVIFGGWKIRLLEERTRCPVATAGSRAGWWRGGGARLTSQEESAGNLARRETHHPLVHLPPSEGGATSTFPLPGFPATAQHSSSPVP